MGATGARRAGTVAVMSRLALAAGALANLLGCGGGAAGDSPDAAGAPPGDAAPVIDAAPPAPPPDLQRWVVGDPSDAIASPRAGVLLMGGGADVDAAFAWQRDRIDGGDVVVLRASGADGYNDYLFDDIGGVDSVETLIVDTRDLAAEPYVRWALDHAEAIFLPGGDQAAYVAAWKDGPIEDALAAAWRRGAVVGGTSAGAMVLGEIVYRARGGSVSSAAALDNPFDPDVDLDRGFVALPPLAGVVVDSHVAARDRMGRLLAFVARAWCGGWAARPIGLGVDEGTALVVDDAGVATALGDGAAYAIVPAAPPATCAPGAPLAWPDVPVHALRDGDTITLPAGATAVPPTLVSASGGALTPRDPY